MIRYTKPSKKRYMFFTLYPNGLLCTDEIYWFPSASSLLCGASVKRKVYAQIFNNILVTLSCCVVISKRTPKCND